FVINGAERVIVSQLHRSPGVVFEESIHPNGQRLFSARIIPFRGSWVEFTIDIHDVIYVHIDKKKKFPATALLRAFGYGTHADILKLFYATKDIDITGKLEGRAQKREVLGTLLGADVPDPENKKGEPPGRVGDELTLEKCNTFRRAGISKGKVVAGYTSLDRLFFHPKRYELGRVGRYKIDQRLKVNVSKDHTVLTEDDFIAIIRYLIELREGRGYTDDIDHLGNRRVRSVGELIANQFSVG